MRLVSIALVLAASSGCALVSSPACSLLGMPYGATCLDVGTALELDRAQLDPPSRLGAALDLPLAFTLDTALLLPAFAMRGVLSLTDGEVAPLPWVLLHDALARRRCDGPGRSPAQEPR